MAFGSVVYWVPDAPPYSSERKPRFTMVTTSLRFSIRLPHRLLKALAEAVFVRVRDGVASGYLHRDENYSFRTRVNTGGQLKAVMPIDSYYRYDEDKPVPLSNLMLIVEADFSNTTRRGAITVGDRRFGFDGCTTTVELIAL